MHWYVRKSSKQMINKLPWCSKSRRDPWKYKVVRLPESCLLIFGLISWQKVTKEYARGTSLFFDDMIRACCFLNLQEKNEKVKNIHKIEFHMAQIKRQHNEFDIFCSWSPEIIFLCLSSFSVIFLQALSNLVYLYLIILCPWDFCGSWRWLQILWIPALDIIHGGFRSQLKYPDKRK